MNWTKLVQNRDHKILGKFFVAAQMMAYQEGLSYM
jgi:hypothetical protein